MNTAILQSVDKIIEKYGYEKRNLLPILSESQELVEFNYIPEYLSKYIAQKLEVKESEVFEVVSFFAALSEKPRGRNVIKICNSTVCRVNDSESLENLIEYMLSIKVGETTSDGTFSLEYSPCFGACDISPAIRIGNNTYGNLDRIKLEQVISSYKGEI